MSPRPRILFLNRSYWPDAEATGQLLTELCEDLADQFDVTVIAGQPNHNAERADYRARGMQRRRGVTIRRVFHTRLSKATLVGRLINFVTYLTGAVVAAFSGPRPDVVVVETDPPLLCILGAWLQRWRGSRLVVYLQDINPEIAVALGKVRSGWLTNWLRNCFAKIYRRADRVIVLSDDMRSVLREWQVPAAKITTLPNWVDTQVVQPVKQENRFRRQQGWDDRFVVMYSGNLGLCQQLDDVLLAAEQLADRDDIQFVLIGQGASKSRLQQLVQERRLGNVCFLDYQPKSDLSVSLSAADVQLVPLDPRIVRYMMPSKLYGILASGTPVLAVAPADCELARLVRTERVGCVAPANHPAALADQIRWCAAHRGELEDMGRRARQLAEERFDRRALTGQFHQLLEELLSSVLPQTRRLQSLSADATCRTPCRAAAFATTATLNNAEDAAEKS